MAAAEDFAAILLSHGIGMGLYLKGKPFLGVQSSGAEFGHMLHVPNGALAGLAIIVALLVVAALANVLAPHSPVIGDLRNARLLPPGGDYWLGTDDQGRDILSRLIYGSRLTLYVVILVAIIAAPIGLIVGTAAGYAGGWVDSILMRNTRPQSQPAAATFMNPGPK